MIPGEFFVGSKPITCNSNRETHELTVTNTGDRPVQVGSHCHFYETNSALDFDREAARGCHLDIPAGTAVRFEPGDSHTVTVVAYGGNRNVYGFRNLVDAPLGGTPSAASAASAATSSEAPTTPEEN